MKQVKKLQKDMVNFEDDRFFFKALSPSHPPLSANALPLFWEETMSSCIWLDPNALDEEFYALLYSRSVSYEDILCDLIINEDLTVFDISNVIHLLESYAPTCNKYAWAKRLHIGYTQWEEFKSLKAFEKEWVVYFTNKRVPLKRILNFTDLLLRNTLLPLLTLNPGINILETILNLLKESAHRSHIPCDMLWKRFSIPELVNDADIAALQKLNVIHSLLFEFRYPSISRYRKEQEKRIKDLDMLPLIHFQVDPNFETSGLKLSLDVGSRDDLAKIENWLNKNKEVLISIIDVQKGLKEND